ncbi:MAG: MFS transporter [Dehalococcoidia bacterium]|nr:MFS transporter [Dehalococcoidia bacterium]
MRSRPFIALYAAVFVATMGISMVSPLLPVYAKELGASGVWLGLTFSVFAIVQTFVGPFAAASDRYGRKPFIVAGLCIYLVAALGYLTAGSFYQVIAFRAFSGLGTSLIFSVARAYVGDMTPKGQEGRWLGVFATADIIGFGTGPLLAGVLREVVGFRSVFVAMAILMATSALILMWWLPRHSPAEVITRASLARGEAREAQTPFAVALKDRLVVAVTAHQGLISLASGVPSASSPSGSKTVSASAPCSSASPSRPRTSPAGLPSHSSAAWPTPTAEGCLSPPACWSTAPSSPALGLCPPMG